MKITLFVLGVVCKLRHLLGRGGSEEFVTVQIPNYSFFVKFVIKMGGVVEKAVFCVTSLANNPLLIQKSQNKRDT